MNYDSWLIFTSIALLATLTPGPAVLLVSTHSISFGTRYSLATMAGNVTGLFVMSLLSVMGLSAIILHSAPVFLTVKLLGAGYLIYLGGKLWRQGFSPSNSHAPAARHSHRRPHPIKLYAHGLVVALSNPKAIAFTTALFPQFIQHDQPLLTQFGILISTFMVLSFTCLLGFALLAEGTKKRARRIAFPNLLSKLFGTAFIGSGVALATVTQK